MHLQAVVPSRRYKFVWVLRMIGDSKDAVGVTINFVGTETFFQQRSDLINFICVDVSVLIRVVKTILF